jgi:hypothetical protein
MAIRRTTGLDRYAVCESYLMNRIRGLSVTPMAVGVKCNADNQVYGAVIDMPMGQDLLTTLVVSMNGTANLFFNTGGGVLGLGQKYSQVSSAVLSFLVSAGQALPSCTKTREYDLPTKRDHYIYLLTRRGVYKMVLDPKEMAKETDKSKRFIFTLYQRVLNELQNAQRKDRAIAQKNGGERVVALRDVNANVQKPQITMTRTNLAKPMQVTGVEHVEITTDETTTEE